MSIFDNMNEIIDAQDKKYSKAIVAINAAMNVIIW